MEASSAPFFGTQEGSTVWLNYRDPPGLVMASISWILIIFSAFAVNFLVLEFDYSLAWIVIYDICTFLCLVAHLKTMMADPGAVPKRARPLASARNAGIPETICGRCDAYKPPRSHHCRICGRCIVRMDHHCPWMNNCIGAKNQKHFFLFLIYASIQCVIALVVPLVRITTCSTHCFPGLTTHFSIAVVVIALLVLIFVSSMIYNQVYAIMTGIGTIDRMKRRARTFHLMPLDWSDVFGMDNWLLWPVPIDPTFEEEDQVLGYTRLFTDPGDRSLQPKSPREADENEDTKEEVQAGGTGSGEDGVGGAADGGGMDMDP
uniref:Palmitoyltransferase n=1 Tax=Rhizochromulina marina TaxID=1034831 RepID=A0A7S2WS54_9STRA|mmetsp:Transcript_31698/g.92091  ORF Transcript_31698/g.92091 Transcript_31698/m.92091 type:complete len:318 (+) Transcript_31698:234-1187(+)|eukprot:CAMPEP_0118970302 /NCGR_PEP_ID=MMETSP1173-20130426/7228_1 /TAXON_ID=1034831 /ORGANISM="Rhizochromulina marina cf, Strain CCMP1243" /LENGTH=317 /DNA_ID=CAMNT_0006919647 /DNA_START=203 /DNA_END=1156 /DNA_ORIENTATION=+